MSNLRLIEIPVTGNTTPIQINDTVYFKTTSKPIVVGSDSDVRNVLRDIENVFKVFRIEKDPIDVMFQVEWNEYLAASKVLADSSITDSNIRSLLTKIVSSYDETTPPEVING